MALAHRTASRSREYRQTTAPRVSQCEEPPPLPGTRHLPVRPSWPASSMDAMNECVMTEHKTTQAEKCKEAARELETDDDPERFRERLRKLVGKPHKGGDREQRDS